MPGSVPRARAREGAGAAGREAADPSGSLLRPGAADYLVVNHAQVGLAVPELGVSSHLRSERGARWREGAMARAGVP